MFEFAAFGLLIAMVLVLVRGFKGPTIFDRILAVNTFGTMTVSLIAVYGFLTDRPDFLDIALVYTLINFIGTIAVTKFVKFKSLGHGHPHTDKDDAGDV